MGEVLLEERWARWVSDKLMSKSLDSMRSDRSRFGSERSPARHSKLNEDCRSLWSGKKFVMVSPHRQRVHGRNESQPGVAVGKCNIVL
jgi:hypothetical protein